MRNQGFIILWFLKSAIYKYNFRILKETFNRFRLNNIIWTKYFVAHGHFSISIDFLEIVFAHCSFLVCLLRPKVGNPHHDLYPRYSSSNVADQLCQRHRYLIHEFWRRLIELSPLIFPCIISVSGPHMVCLSLCGQYRRFFFASLSVVLSPYLFNEGPLRLSFSAPKIFSGSVCKETSWRFQISESYADNARTTASFSFLVYSAEVKFNDA